MTLLDLQYGPFSCGWWFMQAINQTVQKTLRQLKLDCATIQTIIEQRRQQDAAARAFNSNRTSNSILLVAAGLVMLLLLLSMLAARTAGVVCGIRSPGYTGADTTAGACTSASMQRLTSWDMTLDSWFGVVTAALVTSLGMLFGGAWLLWQHQPVLDRRDAKRLDEYAAVVSRVAQQAEVLYEEYFMTLANAGER